MNSTLASAMQPLLPLPPPLTCALTEFALWEDFLYNVHMYTSTNKIFHSLARFIWNAEISVSVAIHCYERLF